MKKFGVGQKIAVSLSVTVAVAMSLALSFATSASAALKPGSMAPLFRTQASLGGNVSTFDLAEALKQGPVVLYFYPAAFTTGCTIEAHLFADATDQYHALGATVIGVSGDNIDTLNKFSVSECRSKFAVAADTDKSIMKSYDATLGFGHANRTSYVITPDRKVLYEYTSLNPDEHVANTLKALQEWKSAQGGVRK